MSTIASHSSLNRPISKTVRVMLGYKQPPTEMAYKESSGHVTHVTDDVM